MTLLWGALFGKTRRAISLKEFLKDDYDRPRPAKVQTKEDYLELTSMFNNYGTAAKC